MTYLAETLAEFAVTLPARDIPERVRTAAKRSVLDTLGAALGGVPTENAATMRKAARSALGGGNAAAWFTGEPCLHPLGALLANCAAASALDIDDGHRGAAGHPGAAIVPAVLMEAAANGHSGTDALAAVIVGYEVGLRVAESRHLTPDISFASGIWTGYGVAAALSRLRGLTTRQTAHAIAIAGTEAPANLPQGACTASSVKGSSPWSTVAARVSVDRAAVGATGSLDLLERSGRFAPGRVAAHLGTRWLITETYFKPYACCRYAHPAIDAILALQAEFAIPAQDIERIDIEIFPEARKLPNALVPVSLEDAQFSLPFTAALAAARGIAAFRPLSPSSLDDPVTLALVKRINLIYPADLAGRFPFETPARVVLSGVGREMRRLVDMPLGDATNPLTDRALEQKVRDLAAASMPKRTIDALVSKVWAIGDAPISVLESVLAEGGKVADPTVLGRSDAKNGSENNPARTPEWTGRASQ